ncbi:unnamed protein product [Amoebophrya sp. A25]|nr:unnamed protein product [Amoebophrya sp. A25]|eukprot:GSA25T00023184001.1
MVFRSDLSESLGWNPLPVYWRGHPGNRFWAVEVTSSQITVFEVLQDLWLVSYLGCDAKRIQTLPSGGHVHLNRTTSVENKAGGKEQHLLFRHFRHDDESYQALETLEARERFLEREYRGFLLRLAGCVLSTSSASSTWSASEEPFSLDRLSEALEENLQLQRQVERARAEQASTSDERGQDEGEEEQGSSSSAEDNFEAALRTVRIFLVAPSFQGQVVERELLLSERPLEILKQAGGSICRLFVKTRLQVEAEAARTRRFQYLLDRPFLLKAHSGSGFFEGDGRGSPVGHRHLGRRGRARTGGRSKQNKDERKRSTSKTGEGGFGAEKRDWNRTSDDTTFGGFGAEKRDWNRTSDGKNIYDSTSHEDHYNDTSSTTAGTRTATDYSLRNYNKEDKNAQSSSQVGEKNKKNDFLYSKDSHTPPTTAASSSSEGHNTNNNYSTSSHLQGRTMRGATELRAGLLEKKSAKSDAWKWREFRLTNESLVYFRAGGGAGGDSKAKTTPLSEFLRVEPQNKTGAVFLISTKKRTFTLRARSTSDREGWILSVAKQAAIVKELELAAQAEVCIAELQMESWNRREKTFRKATSRGYRECCAFAEDTKELFADFCWQEFFEPALGFSGSAGRRRPAAEGGAAGSSSGVANGHQPVLPFRRREDLAAFLCRKEPAESEGGEQDARISKFLDTVAFPLFRRHPQFRKKLENMVLGHIT